MSARFSFTDSISLIKTIRTSGTITPSSPILINRLLKPIDFSKAKCIVELGPGNGCFTRELLRRMTDVCVLVCFEVNDEFVDQLNALCDPRMHVYNACASSIREVLDELNIDEVDHIVSSLPLALIDDEVVSNILASARENLREGGRFLQYQYSLKNYSDVKPVFSDVKLKFTLRNMPPAFVYECIK